MMTALVISDTNISFAWARVFLDLMKHSGTQRHPAVISINQLERATQLEDAAIRAQLDAELRKHRLNSCATVAGTLFPLSMWNPDVEDDAARLFYRYDKAWPGISKCPANRNGVYFRRLTSYLPHDGIGKPVNQLKFVIDTYQAGNHRKSALQASILDPTRDHTNNRQKGFPCLQQISFTPVEHGRLSVTGFYATQYQFEKAYGNYLGLYWLGRFMAKQLGLELTQVVCIASVLSLGDESKATLTGLGNALSLSLQHTKESRAVSL